VPSQGALLCYLNRLEKPISSCVWRRHQAV